jgi:hypothetical protein
VVQCVTTRMFVALISMPLLTELVPSEDDFCYRHGAPNGALSPSQHPISPRSCRAAADAAHIGLAAAHGMDFLLTWNCRHIHNSFIEHRLQGVCDALGLSLPAICTPLELMADYLET